MKNTTRRVEVWTYDERLGKVVLTNKQRPFSFGQRALDLSKQILLVEVDDAGNSRPLYSQGEVFSL